jgi:MFS family permease
VVFTRRYALESGLTLAYSLALLGDQMLYVFLPSHPAAAGITSASLGIILSANRFVRLLANSLGGLVSDRIGRRRPYLVGMVLALASTGGYLASSSFWPLLLARVVLGIAFALISVGGAAIMLDLCTDPTASASSDRPARTSGRAGRPRSAPEFSFARRFHPRQGTEAGVIE